MDATDINKHDVDIFINGTGKNMRPTQEDSSKLQAELDFAFDPQESEAKPHKEISLAESPSTVSPGAVEERSIGNRTGHSDIPWPR